MSTRHDDTYYKSGYIPVAVIDDYTTGNWGKIDHGYIVCNILKKYNPDLSLDRIENHPARIYNKFQKFILLQLIKHPRLSTLFDKHKLLENFIFGKNPSHTVLQMAFDDLNNKLSSGMKYKAVNLSAGFEFEYPEINRLVSKELGVEITPDNIGKFKKEILEVLKTKKNDNIIESYRGNKSSIKISTYLNMIESIEKAKIPFYMASSYKTINGDDTWSILALAENAIDVEAGKIDKNGKISKSQLCSHSSLSIKNNKRYIEDSSNIYDGYGIGGGTSFATPMALAKDLKV